MADLNKALAKLSVGDGLTDDELGDTFALFERLEYDLETLALHFEPGFKLALDRVRNEKRRLEGFISNRSRGEDFLANVRARM